MAWLETRSTRIRLAIKRRKSKFCSKVISWFTNRTLAFSRGSAILAVIHWTDSAHAIVNLKVTVALTTIVIRRTGETVRHIADDARRAISAYIVSSFALNTYSILSLGAGLTVINAA